MIRRPPRSTLDRSSAASDVYKRQLDDPAQWIDVRDLTEWMVRLGENSTGGTFNAVGPVSYTHLRAHETVLDLVCRLLLDKKNENNN